MNSIRRSLAGLCPFVKQQAYVRRSPLAALLLTACLGASAANRPVVATSQVPLTFESAGSLSGTAKSFSALAPGFRLTLQPQDTVIEFLGKPRRNPIHLRLVGPDPNAHLVGLGQLSGPTLHLVGSDPTAWRKAVNFARVRYQSIYPGIDLVYYGNQNQLESDFVLSPHADPNQIQFTLSGAQQLQVDTFGNLLVATKAGEITLGKPQIYQQINGKKLEIAGGFQLQGDRVGFQVGAYDREFPLTIDPTLSYSAAVSRSLNDKVNAIAVAPDGSTYVAGVAPAMRVTDHDEAFVAHISADGKTLLYLTYLGGAGASDARAIALDAAGNAYIAGETKAPDFPVLNALQVTCSLNSSQQCTGDAFIAKINPDGSLKFATYLGGGDEDAANAIAVDATGGIYVAGSTSSLNFPAAHGPQFASGGSTDAFIAKLSSDGLQLLYSTYLGGSGDDQAFGIAVDADLNAYATGQTKSIDFPVKAAFQAQCHVTPTNQCQGQAFLAKISPDGSQLAYSTYFGGSGVDTANAIAVDSTGSVFISGATTSTDFPLAKPLQSQLKGKSEAFVAKFLPDASGLVYATFLGGAGDDVATSIALDKTGKAFIGGQTNSADFPTQGPLQAECHKGATGTCSTDAFLAVLNPSGTGLQFSTYLGGSGVDIGSGVAVDTKGSAYLGASSTTSDFPMAASAVMTPGASANAAKPFGSAAPLAVSPSLSGGAIVTKVTGITPQTACAGTINWTGLAGDNLWTTANNWDTKVLPVATDTVCIGPAFSASTITINGISSVNNQTIASLVSNANFKFAAGVLTVTGGAAFVNSLAITAGTLTLNGTNGSSVGTTLDLGNAVLAGTDTLTVTGLFTWSSGGEMCTASNCGAPTGALGVTNANGGIAGTSTMYLYGRTLNNSAVATFNSASGYFYLNYGSIVNNLAGATWNLTSDSGVTYASINGTFNNAGTFEKTGGSGASPVDVLFINTGKVVANTGTLSFTDVGSSSGASWTVASGAIVNLSAANSATATLTGGSYSGAGTVQFGATGNGIIDLSGAPTFTVAVGITGAVLDITSGTSVTFPSLNLGNATLSGPGTLAVTGLLTWGNGGKMCTADNCTAASGAQGVTNANGGISVLSSGTQYLYGRVLNNAGVATFNGTGNIYLAYSAIVNNLSGATWNLTNDSYVNTSTDGGTFNNAGTFEKTGGSSLSYVYPLFVNTGTVAANVVTLSFLNIGSSTGGTWSAAVNSILNLSAASSSTITLTGGTYSGAGIVQFGTNNTGIIDLAGAATFTVPVGITGAVLDVTAGTTVTVPSLTLGNGILSGPGTMTVTGLLTWTNGGEMCTADNCTAPTGALGVTNASGGIVAPSGTEYLYGRVLNNGGVATFNGTGNFYFAYAAIVNNLAGATWNLTNDSYVNTTTGAGTFNNAGTFEKTGGANLSYVYPLFVNTGTVAANSVTLSLLSVGSASGGTWSAAANAILNLSAASSSIITLTGGTYSGSGIVQFGASNTGTIDLAGTPTVTVPIGIAGAVLDITAGTTVTVPSLTLGNAVLSGPGTMTVTGLLTWINGGEMCTADNCTAPTGAQGITNANGGIVAASGTEYLYGRVLNNGGLATFNGIGNFYLAYAATVNNLAGATWNLTNDSYVNTSTGAGTFNNAGTFEKTGGASLSYVYPLFVNTGTVAANSVTLSLVDVASSTGGSWSAALNSVLNLSAANSATATLTGGNYSGAGIVQFGTTGNGIIDLAGTPKFTVAVGITGSVLDVTAGTTATVPSLNLGSGILSGPGTMTVTGLLTWTSGGQMCTADNCTAPTGALGITNANGGILSPSGTQSLYGRVLNNAGAATFNGTGNFYFAYAAVLNNLSGATWNLTNDSYINVTTGSGTFNNAGTFEKTGGSTLSYVYPRFVNTGTVAANAVTLSLTNIGSSSGGSWSAAANSVLNLSAASSTTMTLTGGTYSGAGIVQFGTNDTGIIDLSGAPKFTVPVGITGAVLDVTAGTTVTVPSLNMGNGILAGPGTMTITGLLTWTNGGEMCTADNCTATTGAQGVTNANGGIATPTTGTQYLYGRTLNNAGVATFNGTSNFYFAYAAVVNNLAGATWNLTNDSYVNTTTGAGTFNNAGTFEKTGGSTNSNVYPAFVNTGIVSSNVATLAFGGTYNQTSGSTILAGGILSFVYAPTIQGGAVTGAGTISGNYNGAISTNPAGIVAPGTPTSAGAIALTGSGVYSQGTGAFNVKIGGTAAGQFDTLSATGTATLGGTLNVTVFNGYSPNSSDKFTILTAASVVGKFAIVNVPAGWTVTYNPTSVVLNAGVGNVPSVGLSVNTLTFPNTAVGKSATPQTVTLTNTGNAALTITSIQSSDPADYTYSADAAKPCPLSPATLAAGSSCIIDVTFTPASSGPHSAQITITDNNNGTAGSTQSIGLTGTGVVLSSIAVTPASATINAGQTQQFTATGTYSDGTTANITSSVTWSSATPSVATIAATGLATGVAKGTSNITATLSGVTSPAAVLTVNGPILQSIAVTPTSATINAGQTQQFTATGTYSDGTTANITTSVTWSSGSPSIATIAATGLATGVAKGTSNITATLGNVTSPAVVLTVNGPILQSIAVTPTSATINAGQTQQFTATGTYSDGSTTNITTSVTWSSGSPSIATIAATGLATGVAKGTSNITATLSGVTSPAAVLTVNGPILQSIAVTPTSATINAGQTQQFTATGTYSDGSTANITTSVTWSSGSPSVATIAANGLATGVAKGTSNITATLGNVTSPAVVLTVNGPILQSIAVTPTTATINAGQTQQFTATGTYSDGSTTNITTSVTWSSGSPSIATIAATGLATGVAKGTSNITATLSGVTSPAAVLTVNGPILQSIAVTPTSATINAGQTQQFTATGTYSDGSTANITTSVTWSSGSPSIATIAATGLATGVAKGTSNITATLSSVTSPAAVLTVNGPILQSIAVTPASATINAGQAQQFTATGTYSDGSTANITSSVTWASGTPAIATIAVSGLATAVAKGTSNITATLGSVTSPAAVLTVNGPILQSIAVTPTTATISAGQTQQFTATGSYSDGTTANITTTVTWSSATPSVATIAATGLATGVAKGTSNITAALGNVTSPAAVLTVNGPILQSIAVTPASATINAGQTQQFVATGSYSDGTTANITTSVTWASGSPSIASIAASGLATGVSKGTSNITATLGNVTSPAAVLTVNGPILQSIAVTPASATIAAGQTQQFTATGTYSDGTTANITSTVTWSSATPSIATIAATGLATGVAKGTSNITATLSGVTSPAAVLTVNGPILQSIAVTPASATIAAGQTQQFTATGTYSDGTTANITSTVTWSSATPSVATIAATGLATGVAKGTSNITATLSGVTSPVAVLTVNGPILQSIAVTPVSAIISAGQTQQFTATGSYSDGTTANITTTVTWSSATLSVATIDATGLATAVAKGTSNITATLGSITSPVAVLTVNGPILRSIAVTPTTATINAGQTQQFIAIATYSDGTTVNITSTVTWSSATPSVATIAASGLATGVSKGTSNIAASLGNVTSPAAVLTVNGPILQSIAVTPAIATISAGQTQQFTATGSYSDGTTANITTSVTWSSGSPSIATIAATGLATGLSKGTSNITATLGAVTSPVAVLTVTQPPLQFIAVTPASATISVGQTQQFTATGTYSDGTTANITSIVTWTSATPSVATIAATGLATGVAKGTSNITATLNGVTSPAAVLTVTSSGEPQINITLLDQSAPGSSFYVDVQVTNTGTGPAKNIVIGQLNFRTLAGAGTVTYNTGLSAPLPISVGSLDVGASSTVRLYLSVPATVTRFAVGESGTVQDTSSVTFNYASSQVVAY